MEAGLYWSGTGHGQSAFLLPGLEGLYLKGLGLVFRGPRETSGATGMRAVLWGHGFPLEPEPL